MKLIDTRKSLKSHEMCGIYDQCPVELVMRTLCMIHDVAKLLHNVELNHI